MASNRRVPASPVTLGLTIGPWKPRLAPSMRRTGEPMSGPASSAGSVEEEVASVEVTNTGGRTGSTVVFAFGGVPGSVHERPERRLLGFRRVEAAPGETVRVAIPLELGLLDVRSAGGWKTEAGSYRIELGCSASDLPVVLELERDRAGVRTGAVGA